MLDWLAQRLAARQIPQGHWTVEACGGQGLSVGAESNSTHALGIYVKRLTQLPAAGHVPDGNLPINACPGEGTPFVVERETYQSIRRSKRFAELLAGCQI